VKLEIQFKDFIRALKPFSNDALQLDKILRPFGISSLAYRSNDILIGHLLDYMEAEYAFEDPIDAIDVAVAAMDLGHEEAELFLDEAPFLLTQMVHGLRA
jgi:hypothetical protein